MLTLSPMNFRLRPLSLLFLVLLTLIGCADLPKSRTDDVAMPAEMTCVRSTDPQCIGEASLMIRIPFNDGAKAKGSAAEGSSLLGFCELFVEDESTAQPCNGISLVVRGARDNEQRTAVIKGYDFKVEGLEGGEYKLDASSPLYQLQTEAVSKGAVNPGQKLKIRVRAKRRP